MLVSKVLVPVQHHKYCGNYNKKSLCLTSTTHLVLIEADDSSPSECTTVLQHTQCIIYSEEKTQSLAVINRQGFD